MVSLIIFLYSLLCQYPSNIMTQYGDAGALQEDPPDYLHEVAQGIEKGQAPDRKGHVPDGEGEPAQKECGHREEECGHEGLLLGLGDGGYEEPCTQGGHEEEDGCRKQEKVTPPEGDPEHEKPCHGDQDHVEEPHNGEGDRLSQDQLDGTDGGDHQLLHVADLLFPHDGHGGEHDRDYRDDVHDDTGHKVVPA